MVTRSEQIRITPRITKKLWLQVRRLADKLDQTFEETVQYLLSDALYQLRREKQEEKLNEKEGASLVVNEAPENRR